MLYKTELHCHSKEVSRCARDPAEHLAAWYVENGYTTVVLTNHFTVGTFQPLGPDATWKDKVDYYVAGYEKLRAAAAGKLHVIFSAELRIADYGNDYLLYGVTPDFFYAHPELLTIGVGTLSELCRREGIFLVQAHPFRDDMALVNPRHLDGIEVYNGARDVDYRRNLMAEMWASLHGMPMTAGSDHHAPEERPDAGILTEQPITTAEELVAALRGGHYALYRT